MSINLLKDYTIEKYFFQCINNKFALIIERCDKNKASRCFDREAEAKRSRSSYFFFLKAKTAIITKATTEIPETTMITRAVLSFSGSFSVCGSGWLATVLSVYSNTESKFISPVYEDLRLILFKNASKYPYSPEPASVEKAMTQMNSSVRITASLPT